MASHRCACGRAFTATVGASTWAVATGNALVCPDCRRERQRAYWREQARLAAYLRRREAARRGRAGVSAVVGRDRGQGVDGAGVERGGSV